MILCSKPTRGKEQLDTFERVENQGPEGVRGLPQAAQESVVEPEILPVCKLPDSPAGLEWGSHLWLCLPAHLPCGHNDCPVWGRPPGASTSHSGRMHCL